MKRRITSTSYIDPSPPSLERGSPPGCCVPTSFGSGLPPSAGTAAGGRRASASDDRAAPKKDHEGSN